MSIRIATGFQVVTALQLCYCLVWPSPLEAQSASQNSVDSFPVFLTPSLRHGLDTSVSPCTDFYQFANGGWIETTKLPDSVRMVGVFQTMTRQTQKFIVQLLDSARRVASTTQDPYFRVLGTYYESCLRADSIPKALQGVSMHQAKKSDTSRASRCARIAMNYLPDAVGQMFVRAVLPPTADAKATQMIESIRAHVAKRISALPFVPDQAKERTLAALRYMTFKVAKPSDTVDYRNLSLVVGDFLSNQRSIQEFAWKYAIASSDGSRRPVWKDSQFFPNAHFMPTTNSIEIPSFMFQWPLFDETIEEALSYASVGTILGHEIMHGITFKLNSEGDASVTQRSQVLVQQYSALRVDKEFTVNGALTLNENLADLGGVLVAYDAWYQTARSSAKPLIEGFTPEQRFFLHYARLWREKTTPDVLQMRLGSDTHSPGVARVNGVMMNVPAFAKAFGCKEGDPMAKPANERAVIW